MRAESKGERGERVEKGEDERMKGRIKEGKRI